MLVGELWPGYEASYQTATGHEGYTGPLLGGTLNYQLFNAIRGALLYGGGLENIEQVWAKLNTTFTDAGALGNFVETHDQPRWLLGNPDVRSYQNGLVAAFFLPGVPIAYYGTEQGMAGGQSDNDKRQPLWRHGGYNTSAPLYQFTKKPVAARKAMLRQTTAATIDAVGHLHSENDFLSFERGGAVVVLASVVDPATKKPSGRKLATVQTSLAPDVKLCDALMPSLIDGASLQPNATNAAGHRGLESEAPPIPPITRCVTTGAGGVVSVALDGLPRVFLRSSRQTMVTEEQC
eukprot:SAG22_NODE_6_length_41368_cov_49.702222_14_plen_292_part_00